MSRIVVLLAISTVSTSALAQQRKYPALNSVGRYFGLGYTLGGYHAGANGQFQIVKNRHPASDYGSRALSYPYQPGYQAFRPTPQNWQSMPSVHLQLPSSSATVSEPPIPATTAEPKPPAGPPPVWLKPYLGNEPPESTSEEIATPAPNDGKPTASPFRFEDDIEASPSDQLLDEDDAEDDLLLLDADDLSARIHGPVPLLRTNPVTTNRYKRANVGTRRFR